ncbi:MAG TPA: M14 family zinc carboxypeptidase, partial [Actinomycetota bacterium]
MRPLTKLAAATLAIGLGGLPVAPAPAQECPAEPTFDPAITSPETAMPGFPDRLATTDEINAYLTQIAEESPRVEVGQFATSWNGTPLLYALVATEERTDELDALAARQQLLRDPRITSPEEAAAIANETPAIVWYTGNVHGGETSGADAALSILYGLAARTDCEALGMLDELVVGIMPTQNPDGRDSASRTNVYGFDMNRDWFARTQPETDGKLDLLDRYPPVLYVDAHEMGSSDFFFPPNADPIHHEISSEAVHWINDLYAPALRTAFEERAATDPANWMYFNYDIYDLFYMGYGDTVPTTAFTAAGMTYEKGTADSFRQRWDEQFVAGWTTLKVAADNKDTILREYARAHRTAFREGERGILEKNEILEPDNELQRQVPGLKVRHYFLPRSPRTEVAHLIDRLLDMDVEVYRVRRPLKVKGFQAYGREPQARRVGRGWYWVPMDQPQKRWIQAMLGEESYVPFPYFYDVTAWSNPLLMNIPAGFTGKDVEPVARRVRAAPGGSLPKRPRDRSWVSFPGDTARSVAAAWELAAE